MLDSQSAELLFTPFPLLAELAAELSNSSGLLFVNS